MRLPNNIGAIILSYGRVKELPTLNALRKSGYDGKLYILIDNKDKQIDWYRDRYGDKVRFFSKEMIRQSIDVGDNDTNNNAAILARWAALGLARDEGLEYAMIMDDDIINFVISLTDNNEYVHKTFVITNINRWIVEETKWLRKLNAKAVGFDTCGQLIGGMKAGEIRQFWRRRIAQAYLIDCLKEIDFRGRSQEDLTACVLEAMRGGLLVSIGAARITTKAVESMAGGMTNAYKDMGQAAKNLYPVLYCPSAMKCFLIKNAAMGVRTHVKVVHEKAYPKLIRYDYCK